MGVVKELGFHGFQSLTESPGNEVVAGCVVWFHLTLCESLSEIMSK